MNLKRSQYANQIKSFLLSVLEEDRSIIPDDFFSLVDFVYDEMKRFFGKVDKRLIKTIIWRMCEPYYKINLDHDFEQNSLYIQSLMRDGPPKVPKDKQKLLDHFRFLESIPQHEQKSKEWFEQREGMFTASTAAATLNEGTYQDQVPDKIVLQKVGLGPPFPDNEYVHHGNKYEEIATMIYENLYNCKITEFGLLPHVSQPPCKCIGASPDGIGCEKTLNGLFNPRLGRMLEIKCPYRRQIEIEGEIDGEICPHYYWLQVQQQLECADLEYCDFWQCKLEEYDDREEWLEDVEPYCENYREQAEKMPIKMNLRKGCVIKLLPKKIDPEKMDQFYKEVYGSYTDTEDEDLDMELQDKIEKERYWRAKFIYPPDLDMTCQQYEEWVMSVVCNLEHAYPVLAKDYYFDRVLYWRLSLCHNVTIQRDREWFAEKRPIFEKEWERVEYYRANPEEAKKLQEKFEREEPKRKAASRKKYLAKLAKKKAKMKKKMKGCASDSDDYDKNDKDADPFASDNSDSDMSYDDSEDGVDIL